MIPNSIKPLYFCTFEEHNGNKYLTLKKYEGLWMKIKDFTRSINNNSGDHDEKYVKINLIQMMI